MTFAKKTGDYQSLSAVDMKVVALTYQLECEEGTERGANLRLEPARMVCYRGVTKHNGFI